jgi:DNA-binding NarL/FixJ family response regulator
MVAFRGTRRGMIRPAVARPGDAVALEAAIDELRDCDLLVLHSVTYAEAERAAVAVRSGKPVVMARHLVASAIREALDRLAGPCGNAVHGAPRTHGAPHNGTLRDRLRTLSQREREIMFLVADGLANKEIAFRLGISFRTVEIHRARMMGKMEFSTMADLVRTVDSLSEF